ncbi:site-specific integrase [Bacteroides thetaiotaomicron]|uniref:site-specific integrase n=1 Tax=Bacteroides thetaiotaomicron TaxID=818 RepID=UPI0021645951|nr:site-specific integrase [Bacteroides thetaiotaomicron]UVS55314.1 site-specific integrase [Bacteroides thetaiotaomicron]
MRSTFSTIFYLKRQVVKKDGTVPIMGRITVDGTQTQFSCKLTIDPKIWETKTGRATGRSTVALETNRMLDKIRVKINTHYQEIMDKDNFVTAEKVKNAFLGLEHRCHTLMKVYEQFTADYAKMVEAGMKSKKSYEKYLVVYKHLKEFLMQRYHVQDIALKELTQSFIMDFDMFLRTDKHCCNNTVWIYVCPLRTMISVAISNEWLMRDPFRDYEIKKEETVRTFLTKEEIQLLMDGKLKNAKQELYRDMFLFCIFTGLSFSDMRNLREENIVTYFDDHQWIKINRQKTGVESNIRLLDVPLRILEKYRRLSEDGRIFPVPHYMTCLHGIRSVAKRCGITKSFGWHSSRHTAATTVLLSNGVPIETVSSILGHKNISTTQIYAKITKEKLNQDMENLEKRLGNIESFLPDSLKSGKEDNVCGAIQS